MSDPGYVFEVDGDVAVPTDLARGPWSPHAQHGGAPSALLAGQLEGFEAGPATFPARYTLELMRPVPLTPLRIERRTIRPGKKVQLQGSLFAPEVEVVRATLGFASNDWMCAARSRGTGEVSVGSKPVSTCFEIGL